MRRSLIACWVGLSLGLITTDLRAAADPLGEARDLFSSKQYDRAKTQLAPAAEQLTGARLDEALLLLAALETNPERATALYERVRATGNERAALRAALEVAKIWYSRGEYQRALDSLSPVGRRETPPDPAVSYLQGLCYRQLGDKVRARAEFVKIDRGEYLLWSSLALADIDADEGKIAQAVERYETIGGKHANPIASFKLGECYEVLGQRDKSIEVYRALVANFPRSFEASQGREKILRLSQPREEAGAVKPAKGGEEGTSTGQGEESGARGQQMYAIQFGAFSERENAVRMAKKIEQLIKDVRVESSGSAERSWHRVRGGHYASRKAAERDAAFVRERLGYPGTVVPLR